jgi:hypothetical protein
MVLIIKNSLVQISRSYFFIVWNLACICTISILRYVTYFDFEDGGIWDLALSTMTLACAVNAAVFHFFLPAESRGDLVLLRLRPISALNIVLGRFLGVGVLQIIVCLAVLAVVILERSALPGTTVDPDAWQWGSQVLNILMLTCVYSLVGSHLPLFWALVAMVCIFLLGHSGTYLRSIFPGGLIDALFCAVPDLGREPIHGGGSRRSSSQAIWLMAYFIMYISFITGLCSLLLSRATIRK